MNKNKENTMERKQVMKSKTNKRKQERKTALFNRTFSYRSVVE